MRKLGPRDYIRVRGNKFQARVTNEMGVRISLGIFPTLEQAQAERDAYFKRLYDDIQSVETDSIDNLEDGPYSNNWALVGVTAEEGPDEDEIYFNARRLYEEAQRKTVRKLSQRLSFYAPTVCVVFVGDQHLGNDLTDVVSVFEEAEEAVRSPHTYVVTVGDLIDNFIFRSFMPIRTQTHQSIPDEWVLARRYMRTIAPRWIAAVAGNHDGQWNEILTGMDWMRETIGKISPKVLYDNSDCRVDLDVMGTVFPGRIRHQWRGYSMYNGTHGIERAALFDKDFVWGVGGHTHVSGLVRTFNLGGRNGVAALCGSYKAAMGMDEYARQEGFMKPNTSTAVALVFDAETESITGFDNISMATRFMSALYK